ncbi:MAG: hypothetical protein AAGA95_02370, partial [Pseudomonadota bacterium]
MSMQKSAEWLSLLGNLAVLAGIGLLVFELNQNQQATKDGTQLALLALLHERDAWLHDDEFAKVVLKAEEELESLNALEQRRYTEWLSGKWNACEYIYERYSDEMATDSYWAGWDNGCKALLDSPSSRKAWRERR